MEEKSGSDLMAISMSDWKLKQESLRNLRNYRQLENRLLILEMQRQAKVKSIERKLDQHKKIMEVKMDRFKLKQEIQKHDQSVNEETGTNSRVFRDARITRTNNIRNRSSQLRDGNHRLFQQVKKQREENERYIREESEREALQKAEKRNRVRLIEIQSKENINKFWKTRLGGLKEARSQDMASRLQREERNLETILQLERSEQELLNEIKRTQQMELQLESMMEEERSMVLTCLTPNLPTDAQ